MDALSRLMGGKRVKVADGLYVHRVPAGVYLRAYSARDEADSERDGNMRFSAELIAGALHDEDGKRVLESGHDALEKLPLDLFVEFGAQAAELNSVDEDAEGKSEDAP